MYLDAQFFVFFFFHQVNINESLQEHNIFLHIVRAVHLFLSVKMLSHRVVTRCYCCCHRRRRRCRHSSFSARRGGKWFDELAIFQRKYIFIPLAMFGKNSALTLSIETFRIKYKILYYWWILFVVITAIFFFFYPPSLTHTFSVCVLAQSSICLFSTLSFFISKYLLCHYNALAVDGTHTKSNNLAVRWKETLEHYSKKTAFYMLIFRLR